MKNNYFIKILILLIFITLWILFILNLIYGRDHTEFILRGIVLEGFIGVMLYLKLIYDKIR